MAYFKVGKYESGYILTLYILTVYSYPFTGDVIVDKTVSIFERTGKKIEDGQSTQKKE